MIDTAAKAQAVLEDSVAFVDVQLRRYFIPPAIRRRVGDSLGNFLVGRLGLTGFDRRSVGAHLMTDEQIDQLED